METKGEVEVDRGGLQELKSVQDRIAAVWPGGTFDLLSNKNPGLLTELTKLESVLDSLLSIPVKPPVLKKQWASALAEYEKTAMLCIVYAKRHLDLALKTQGN